MLIPGGGRAAKLSGNRANTFAAPAFLPSEQVARATAQERRDDWEVRSEQKLNPVTGEGSAASVQTTNAGFASADWNCR